MATLTIRRLEEADREWLKHAAECQGLSMEEYVRRMIRSARQGTTRTFGDVLERMNASLDDDARALLGEPPPMERPALRAREVLPSDDASQGDDAPARAAS